MWLKPMPATLVWMSRGTREPEPARSIGEQAEENLRFIRRTMERSSTFTAVPGLGGAGMGMVGVAAAMLAANQGSRERWLGVWLAAAVVALSIGLAGVWRKAARLDAPLGGLVARRFAVSLAAPIASGAALTWGAWTYGNWELIPAVWLLLYGTGVLAAGAFSVAPVRLVGAAFMALGVAALAAPAWGNLWLGLGFGGLQIAFGLYIARKHGG
jgi:hypothetical protein